MDRERIIERIHEAIDMGVCVDLFMDVLELLKEQDDLGTELTNAIELIHKKNERIEKLSKEQEPRVLDWDEVKNYSVVWGEFRGVEDIYPLIVTLDTKGRPLSWNPNINVSDEFLFIVYNEEDRKNTRCWNHEPSDEQRQAVKWK